MLFKYIISGSLTQETCDFVETGHGVLFCLLHDVG